ncbi:MAG: MMPL family transporter [Acidobacteria bacterium]|nr:MMPL family transporter [Acidobacteriota bacterium]
MALGPEKLARASALKPWKTVGIWIGMLLLAGFLSSQLLADALTTDFRLTDNPESEQAKDLVEELRGESAFVEFIVITSDTASAGDPDYVAHVTTVQNAVIALGPEVVSGVGSFVTEDGPVSESGRTALLPVFVAGDGRAEAGESAEFVKDVVAEIANPAGFTTLMAGQLTLDNDFTTMAEEDLAKGESIGIGVALVVLVIVFGTVVSGVIPLILGIVAIAIAVGLSALLGQFLELSFFIVNIITMIGLAVGIDYSLFIVSRYREERARGLAKVDAIARAGGTATRAVFFSGLTVVLALFGMVLLPNSVFRSIGLGAILVVLVAVGASMTLLPAVLSLLGDRINLLRVRRFVGADEGRFWNRITRFVMGRPIVALVSSVGILLIAGAAFFSMDTGFSGVSTMPDDIPSKQAFEILDREFSAGLTSPVEIVVRGSGVDATIAAIQADLSADGRFGPSFIDPAATDNLSILSVPLLGDINSNASLDLVREIRSDVVPAALASGTEVFVGGRTAFSVDFLIQTATYTPIVFVFVLGLSFILLTVAFRSLVIPAKAIVMNLLSVGAAYGMVVLFFQAGVGPAWIKSISSSFGFQQVEVIEAFIPLFMFSILFGLSMDYHVFLLSRIKEHFDVTGDNAESVAYGLRTTGSLITGAALIMLGVFGGFAAGRLAGLQQMGFGLAVAVLMDATVVRTILVPAAMRLLGDKNWYLPSWLEWIPNVAIEGTPDPLPTEVESESELVSV